jgi:hypothetical protein
MNSGTSSRTVAPTETHGAAAPPSASALPSRANSQTFGRSVASSPASSAAVSRDSTAERAELIARLSALRIPGLEEASRAQRNTRSEQIRQIEEESKWVNASDIRLSTDPRASGAAPTRQAPSRPPRSSR